MARPREPSRSAAAGAGGASTAGWSRPARARRRPRGPTREYRSAAERGGWDRHGDREYRLSAARLLFPGGIGLRTLVLLSRPQPGSTFTHWPRTITDGGAGERGSEATRARIWDSNSELPGGLRPFCVHRTRGWSPYASPARRGGGRRAGLGGAQCGAGCTEWDRSFPDGVRAHTQTRGQRLRQSLA